MKTEIKLGIWMDHQTAKIITFSSANMQTSNVQSSFTHEIKQESLSRSEHVMNNKEQHFQSIFFKELAEIIKQYSDVILFGPTNAKIELFNMLKLDSHFKGININVETADKLTEPQQHSFVRDYFKRSL